MIHSPLGFKVHCLDNVCIMSFRYLCNNAFYMCGHCLNIWLRYNFPLTSYAVWYWLGEDTASDVALVCHVLMPDLHRRRTIMHGIDWW